MSSPALAAGAPHSTNLRPQDDRLTPLLRAGIARSATLKSLVDRIEASRVIVYVAINPMMKPNLSGMLTWMTQAGGFRYVRASINTDLTPDQMIATIAHELQHAVEVIEDEAVNRRKEPGGALPAHRPAERQRRRHRAGKPTPPSEPGSRSEESSSHAGDESARGRPARRS